MIFWRKCYVWLLGIVETQQRVKFNMSMTLKTGKQPINRKKRIKAGNFKVKPGSKFFGRKV